MSANPYQPGPHAPYSQYGPYAYPVIPVQQARTDGLAVAALVVALAGIAVAAIVCGALAIIFAGVALSRIAKSNGARKGNGLAVAGLVIGLIDVVLFLAFVGQVAAQG
jgi:hypothetical protein